jgi:hypothetical protein
MTGLPNNIALVKQLEIFTRGMTKEGISRMDLAYVPGLGAALLKAAPESFRKIQMDTEKAQLIREGREASDHERFSMQLTLMKHIREQIEERNREQMDRDQRLVKAFQKLVIEPKVSEDNKPFLDIEGSNIKKHVAKSEDLKAKVQALQQVIAKTDLSQLSEQSRNNLVRDITAMNKENNSLEKEQKELKPDQDSINKAFIKGSQMNSDKLIKSLQGMGYTPSEGVHGELSYQLGKGGVGTDTVSTGKQMGLGERIVRTLAETARYLFTPTEKYQALTDKSIASNETALKTKNDHAGSYQEMAHNEKQYSFATDDRPLREQIEIAAARLELKIDWNLEKPLELAPEKKKELTY